MRRRLLAAARLARPSFAKAGRAKKGRALPCAFFLTDPWRTPDPGSVVKRLPRGMGVIYRHFGAGDRLIVARRLAKLCRSRGLILLIAADPRLAARVRAHGVHWPEMRLAGVRHRSPGWIETASAHDARALARAARLGIDAAIVSPIFPSRSAGSGKPVGVRRFRAMARGALIPVYAMGGIGPVNAARVMTHAAGWAAIDSVVDAWGS
jgi:thiamine-phosphate pyrophosphorylase